LHRIELVDPRLYVTRSAQSNPTVVFTPALFILFYAGADYVVSECFASYES